MPQSNLYLESTILSGYKSIEKVKVVFNKGLNIIIGKNAAGKTNFLNFLNNSLNFNFSNSNNFESEFTIISDNSIYKFEFSKKTNFQFLDKNSKDKNEKIYFKKILPEFSGKLLIDDLINKTKSEFSINEEDNCNLFIKNLSLDNIKFKSTFIKHGIPNNYLIINEPLNIELINRTFSDDFFSLYNSSNQSNLFNRLFKSLLTPHSVHINFFNKKLKKEESILKFTNDKRNKYKSEILQNLKFLNDLKLVLKEYSPIENIRINENFLIEIDMQNETVNLKNFYLEYYIDKKWYSFEDLSDGTKRIFYIISEIFTLEENFFADLDILNIVFIEEPELGIHPHQLYNLMRFVKEKSRSSQIIITTHSPLSLDILEKNELDSVIIAEKIDGKTSLNKLSKEKIKKAELYMDELNLSDFWLNSDLED